MAAAICLRAVPMPIGQILARFCWSLCNAMTYWAPKGARISARTQFCRRELISTVKAGRYGYCGYCVWCWCVLCVA